MNLYALWMELKKLKKQSENGEKEKNKMSNQEKENYL